MPDKPFTTRELYNHYLAWIEHSDDPDARDLFGRRLEPYTFAEFKALLPNQHHSAATRREKWRG